MFSNFGETPGGVSFLAVNAGARAFQIRYREEVGRRGREGGCYVT